MSSTANALQVRHWGPKSWQWRLVPTTDARLSAEVNPGDTDVLGSMVWTGYSKILAALNAMPKAEAADAVRQIRDGLMEKFGSYLASSELTRGPAGSLTANNTRPEQEFSLDTTADPSDLNVANNDFWDKRLGRATTKDHTGDGLSTSATPQSIQTAQDAFWAGRRAAQDAARREFGKGSGTGRMNDASQGTPLPKGPGRDLAAINQANADFWRGRTG